MENDATTLNGFLGGRIMAAQPKRGFRAGHDTVLLAAAVPALVGDNILELGAGVGIASLCLAARVTDCRITGLEIDAALAALANDNAARNGMASRVQFLVLDVKEAAAHLPASSFDHIFLNPPFYPASGQTSADSATDRAKRDMDDAVTKWTALALRLVKPGGTVTTILRADREPDMLRAAAGWQAAILPLAPRANEPPKRIIIQLRQSRAGSVHCLPPFILHQPDGKPTPEAEAVLRAGEALFLA